MDRDLYLLLDRAGRREKYINKSIPSLKEVALRNDADSLSQLHLEVRWDRDHESDDLTLDGQHIGLRQLVSSVFILVSAIVSAICVASSLCRTLTVQFLKMKFLKYRAPARRVFI